jgi:hypothetical protein
MKFKGAMGQKLKKISFKKIGPVILESEFQGLSICAKK